MMSAISARARVETGAARSRARRCRYRRADLLLRNRHHDILDRNDLVDDVANFLACGKRRRAWRELGEVDRLDQGAENRAFHLVIMNTARRGVDSRGNSRGNLRGLSLAVRRRGACWSAFLQRGGRRGLRMGMASVHRPPALREGAAAGAAAATGAGLGAGLGASYRRGLRRSRPAGRSFWRRNRRQWDACQTRTPDQLVLGLPPELIQQRRQQTGTLFLRLDAAGQLLRQLPKGCSAVRWPAEISAIIWLLLAAAPNTCGSNGMMATGSSSSALAKSAALISSTSLGHADLIGDSIAAV